CAADEPRAADSPALRASRRALSAADRDPRHAGRAHARPLSPLPRERVPERAEARGHPDPHRAAQRRESVRRPAQRADPPPEGPPQARDPPLAEVKNRARHDFSCAIPPSRTIVITRSYVAR